MFGEGTEPNGSEELVALQGKKKGKHTRRRFEVSQDIQRNGHNCEKGELASDLGQH